MSGEFKGYYMSNLTPYISNKKRMSVKKKYIFGKEIGRGANSIVRNACHH